MRLDSGKVIFWYSLVSGIAVAAPLFAYTGFALSLLGLLLMSAVSYVVLNAVRRIDESSSPYRQLSDQVAIVGIVLLLPMMLFFGLLISLLLFLGLAFLALLFQTHDYRRFYVGLGVGFILLIAGAVETRSGFYLAYFLAYAVAVSMALGYAYIDPRSGNRAEWRLSDRFRASLWLILTAVIIYLVLPRFPAGNLGAQPGSDHFYKNSEWEREAKARGTESREDDPAAYLLQELAQRGEGESPSPRRSNGEDAAGSDFHYRGFEAEMDINHPDVGGERLTNGIVARMRADRPLYLRARVFDRFDGVHWTSSATQLEKLKLSWGQLQLRDPPSFEQGRIEHHEIFIEQNLGNYVAAAAVPVKVSFPGTVIGIDAFGQLHAPGALREGSGYAIDSLRHTYQGRSFAELDYVDLPQFKQLPEDLDPRIARLASRVVEGHMSELEQAVALEQHLRTQYAYDFSSVFTSQNRTPLSRFLFETKRGHCEYFASALAIMLRTQGIPSRLVTGFSASNLNPLTGYYDIYALDGHAWVEAYVDGLGWMELEPTAYYDGPSVDNQTLSAEQINDYVERQLRLQQAMGEEGLTLEAFIAGLWQSAYLVFVWTGGYLKLFLIRTWPWLVGVVGLLIAVRLAWPQFRPSWRAYRIRKQLASMLERAPDRAMDHYLAAIDALLRNAGYSARAGLTIEEYLRELGRLDLSLDLRRMSSLFNRLHYAGKGGVGDASGYQRLFDALYAMGHKALKQRIAAGSVN
ncbi:MAG: transglutaminaseTgpA domain-containing protein [Candidatus Thiodiazotropha sp.]